MSYLRPGVPDSVTILSGPEGARSHTWATLYAEYVKQHGINAKVVATAGAQEILSQLSKDDGSVVAFLQSGAERETPDGKAPEGLESLGSLYFEPNWVFIADGSGIEDVPDLAGKRVFPGPTTRWSKRCRSGTGMVDAVLSLLLAAANLGASAKPPSEQNPM